MARHDEHERGLRDDAGERAEESEERLKENRENENGDEGHGQVAKSESGEGECIERHAQAIRKLGGQQAADDGAEAPAGFEKAESTGASMQNVGGESDHEHVGADHSGHENGVGDAERANGGLLAKISDTFLEIR